MLKKILIATGATIALAACSPSSSSMQATPTPDAMMQQQESGDEVMMEDTSTNTQDGVMVGGAMMVREKDIVDNAVMSKDHTTVVKAVQAAGLVETLKGPGPFTVFAPTNAAFEKLPAGTVETLLKPENKAKLTGILTYHVVQGAITADQLTNGQTLKTVQGETLTITEKDGKWYINGTTLITIPDVISSNGVTHVVDTVLMPKM